MTTQSTKIQVGLAGEYHVLAQLAQRGIVGALTLGHTKGVDILVSVPRSEALFKVEVKTTRQKPGRASVFGDEPFYSWPMNKKHEDLADPHLVYVFVQLSDPGEMPLFFVVPSREVAQYVKWQHEYWLSTLTSGPVKSTTMRKFRIEVSDPQKYQDNWSVLSGDTD